MSKRLFNPLWLHFSEPSPGKAKCLHCDQIVSRGSAESSHSNTTNIWSHLQSHHPEVYLKTKKQKEDLVRRNSDGEQAVARPLTQPSPSNTWRQTDPKTHKLDRLIIEMCAMDELPFSVVSGLGFKRLLAALEPKYSLKSEKFYRSDHFEVLYKTVQTAVRMLLSTKEQESCLSFTVDCVPGAQESLMSLTAHFIDEQWERRRVVLHVKAMTQPTSEDYLQQFFLPVLKYWSIRQRRVYLVLRDRGADMSEEERLQEVPGLSCAAHVLQSVVETGLSSQSDAQEVIAKVRACVQHFQDSILAKQRLRVIQNELNVPQNELEVDEARCWRSLLQMLRSAQEQRRALNSYAQKHSSFSALSSEDWELVKGLVQTLTPVEEVTREMNDSSSLISCVIPSVSVLKMLLQTDSAATRGTATLRQTMLQQLEQTYANLENTKVLVLATLLDPRYKCNLLSPKALSDAPRWLREEHAVWRTQKEEDGEDEEEAIHEECAPVEEEKSGGADLVEQMFASLLGSQPPVVEQRCPELPGQLEQYLNEPLIDRKQADPLAWWKSNIRRFDLLAPLAQKLLSAPPASVPTERLLPQRAVQGSPASGDNAEKLYFLKRNLPLIKYDY